VVDPIIEMAEVIEFDDKLDAIKKTLFALYGFASCDRTDIRSVITSLFYSLFSDSHENNTKKTSLRIV
jgi:hypothetical protein